MLNLKKIIKEEVQKILKEVEYTTLMYPMTPNKPLQDPVEVPDKEEEYLGESIDYSKYPESHQMGMKVPLNGSDCQKCKFVSKDNKSCGNKVFIEWNNNSSKLPYPANEYCCDQFITSEKYQNK